MQDLKSFKFDKVVIRTECIDYQIYFNLEDALTAVKQRNNIKRIKKSMNVKFLKTVQTNGEDVTLINELGLYQVVFGRHHAEEFIDYMADVIYPQLRKTDYCSDTSVSNAENDIKKIDQIINYHRHFGKHFKTPEDKTREMIAKEVKEKLNVDIYGYLELSMPDV